MVVTRSGEDTAIAISTDITTPSRHIGAGMGTGTGTGVKTNGVGSSWISRPRKSFINGAGRETKAKETEWEPGDAEDAEDDVDVGTIKLGELNLKGDDEDGGMEIDVDDGSLDGEEDGDDIDDETLQNTRINEYMCIAPRRMLRRRATSRLNNSTNRNRDPNANPSGSESTDTEATSSPPNKHVKFADEPCPVRRSLALESQKAAWQNREYLKGVRRDP